MQRRGNIDSVFSIDTDRIELAPSSSYSDINSTGSQNNLTDNQTNLKFILNESVTANYKRSETPQNLVRRWSQNLSKFSKNKRQNQIKNNDVFKLPSRKVFEGQFLIDGTELEIDEIANEIEQNEEIMEDSAKGESLRMDTIRALPHSLTIKRKIKEKLAISMSRNSNVKSRGFIKLIQYKIQRFINYCKNNFHNLFRNIELWYDSMKQIEGHFGSGVCAYFQFLRWLFALNLFLFILTFGFIILPQILYNYFQIQNNFDYEINNNNRTLKMLDFLTGEGYLKKTILFYGAYTNMTINLGTFNDYSLPHAYFMTMLCLYLFTFIVVSVSMARSYRKSFIETYGGVRNLIAHKVFCSWDFGISNEKAANLKHSNIYNELKEVLNEIHNSKEKLSKMWKFWIFCSQLTAHLLVFAILGGLGIGMWMLLQYYGEENESSPWATLYLAITLNITIIILQIFFSWIARMEDYNSPRRILHVTLLRNFLLESVIVVVLILFWLNKNYHGCWETSIGQEIYRLIIIDFFVSVLGSSAIQFIQVFVINKIFINTKRPEFDISRKSLGLVFNQTLLWVGLLFSPLLAAVVVLKMILTFYIKKLTLLYLCKSPTHLWRSAQTQTLYLVITFLSLLGVLIVHGYIMTQVPISQTCGPFRGNTFIFQIFIDGVLKLQEHHLIWRIVTTFTRPAVMGGILLMMAVIVYYLRSKSHARITMVKLLKDMLYLEAKDKEFLLWNIARVSQGREWLINDDNHQHQYENHLFIDKDIYTEPTSTWKYEAGNSSEYDSAVRSRHIHIN